MPAKCIQPIHEYNGLCKKIKTSWLVPIGIWSYALFYEPNHSCSPTFWSLVHTCVPNSPELQRQKSPHDRSTISTNFDSSCRHGFTTHAPVKQNHKPTMSEAPVWRPLTCQVCSTHRLSVHAATTKSQSTSESNLRKASSEEPAVAYAPRPASIFDDGG